MTSTVKTDLS